MVNPFYKIQIFDWVLQSWPQKHFNVNRPIRLIRFLIKLSYTLRNLSFWDKLEQVTDCLCY